MVRTVILAVAALLAAAGVAAMAKEPWESGYEKEGWRRLTSDEIRQIIFDATLIPEGKSYRIYIGPDGKMRFKSFLGRSDVGVAKVTEEHVVCREWAARREGETFCTSVWQKDDTYMTVLETGKVYRVVKIARGNSENI